MKIYRFTAVIEKDEDGYYAYCPDLQGCYTSGNTYEEARANLADAIRLHVEDRLACGESVTPPDSTTFDRLANLQPDSPCMLRKREQMAVGCGDN